MNNDDQLLFIDDGDPITTPQSEQPQVLLAPWKVMIIDDQEEVHMVTKLALRRLTFENRSLEFISAYSAGQARELLQQHPDTAVILLDVVMEEEDSGLKMVKYIRTELNNSLVRIILRTGQPGQAPEQSVIMDYDINDYKEKTELTAPKLISTLVTSLRSFRDLSIIEVNRRSLSKIIEASASIFELQSMRTFASAVLSQLTMLLRLNRNALYCHASGFAATNSSRSDEFLVLAGSGDYEKATDQLVQETVPSRVWEDFSSTLQKRESQYFPDRFVMYFRSKRGSDNLIYLDGLYDLNDWDRNLIEIFCMNVSIAFDNIILNQEIEETQREIIFTLGEITEVRSQETGFHVKRVAEYSRLLGLKYGLPPEEAELLRMASPLHDIGKMAIADAVLNKPGKLTLDEFELIKLHSTIGYEMLNKSKRSIIQAGALIAHQHHERYDGSGYPHGLKGQEIHIYSRIVALTDVFDALGSRRVYKKAWEMDEILKVLKKERGRQFDPVLVDLFLENLDAILQIRDQFPDGGTTNGN
ncbi:MAG TPA: DUF3369 domain-containing protein [Patescibacteria group bacterium]|nr:DUF3369 domain-containing protein [Patescibacteria group bacterium]